MYYFPHQSSSLAALLLAVVSLATLVSSQNIDTAQPILREVAGLDNRTYFGYSIALHQTANNPTSFIDAINGARIVVSAPRGTATGSSAEPRTGLVYSCPVNMGDCDTLPGKLFDMTANENRENKTDQFLGSSMFSNGDRFIVCAHRYTRIFRLNNGADGPFPLGKCFYTNGRALDNFQEYQPCSQDTGTIATFSVGVCQAGTSSVIVPAGNSFAFGVGAPGTDSWRGALIRRSQGGATRFQSTSSGTERNGFQGYAVTGGYFRDTNRQDFAVSVPRRNSYFGSVNIVMNDNNLALVSQPLVGLQMGEYYGFSLLAADLNGDGLDELLVGAPLYRANSTEPDTGRVFLYRNVDGNLEFVRTIEGRIRYSRFGYAMANLGDINGDTFDDVAISAPFTETDTDGTGTVFIYHSSPSQLLTTEPQQIITGRDLSLTQDLSTLRGFGASLASGVDVDVNGYNDLLIGSFMSQQVFLLRTRPLARVQTTISSNPAIVDVNNRMRPECELNSIQYSCFIVTVCATYTGIGLENTLNLDITLMADTQNVERRIVFADNTTQRTATLVANRGGSPDCTDFTAYIRNPINDIFNPFIMEVSIASPPRMVTAGNGNETPQNLEQFPVVSIFGNSQIQVETAKMCAGGECIPDLRITRTATTITSTDRTTLSSIIAGFTSSVEFMLTVDNPAEDAFQARLVFDLPTSVLELVNIFNQTSNGEVSLACNQPEVLINDNGEQIDLTRHDCSIGNPFSGPGSIVLRVELSPRSGIVGNENDVSINFTVSSINPENQDTITDNSNFVIATLTVEARADISIDNGVVTPTQISYSDNTPLSNPGASPNTTTDLGPSVDVSFLIRNSGPSRIPTAQLDISWPLNSSLTGRNYYLYISSIQSNGRASVTCTPEYINPEGLTVDVGGDQEGGGDPTVSMGSGRRKRRSTIRRTLRNKRQEVVAPTDQELSQNVTLSCAGENQILNCVNIRCTVVGLPGASSTQIDVTAQVDERFFSMNNDRYVFIPTASVSIVSDFIEPNSSPGSTSTTASAQIRVIPAARVVTVGVATPVPWWAIFVPILAAVIIITVVTVLLWVFGFFRRRKHEEIKARREELQNLNDNGITPAGAPEEVAKF